MRMRRGARSAAWALIGCVLECVTPPTHAQAQTPPSGRLIVLAPQAHYGPYPTAADFNDMFQPDAAWMPNSVRAALGDIGAERRRTRLPSIPRVCSC